MTAFGARGAGVAERTSVRTACPLDCWDTCTLLADVAGGQVVGLRGDPDHPITRGRLCPKARFQLDRHRSPFRLRFPLVRAGLLHGAASPWPGFVRTTWPETLDLVAGKLLEARDRSGSLSVIHYWENGSMGALKDLYQRLFNLFGGVTEPRGGLCWSAGIAAQEADFGRVLSHAPQDLAKARAVVIWGRNPSDTNVHILPFVREARAGGAVVVVVDPLLTATVRELGARHIAPRPGTDAVLALAVGGELVRQGRYDEAFCRGKSRGFAEFARAVTGGAGTLQAAARFCGVPEEDILFLVRLLQEKRPTAFLMGFGLQRHARGGEAVRAIDALAALAGSIGRSGGGANYASRHASGVLRDLAGDGLDDGRGRPVARRFFDRPQFGRQAPRLDNPTPLALFCDRANPVAQLPDTNRVVEAFRAIPFKVVAELVMTDTAALADVVLPVADFLEDEDLLKCSWHTHFTWSTPSVAPPEDVWPETRVVAELGRRLGFGEEFTRSPAEWIAWTLAPLLAAYPDVAERPEELRGRFFANPAAPAVPWADGLFATPSGRFEFGTDWPSLEALGRSAEAPVGAGTAELAALESAAVGGLFHLITPRHRLSLNSQFYDKVLAQTSGGSGLPAVFANPRAAARLGLVEGDEVRMKSESGELQTILVMDEGLREDTVCIYGGGQVGLIAGARPASANFLTPDNLTDIGAQAAYYDCRCSLEATGRRGDRPPGRPASRVLSQSG